MWGEIFLSSPAEGGGGDEGLGDEDGVGDSVNAGSGPNAGAGVVVYPDGGVVGGDGIVVGDGGAVGGPGGTINGARGAVGLAGSAVVEPGVHNDIKLRAGLSEAAEAEQSGCHQSQRFDFHHAVLSFLNNNAYASEIFNRFRSYGAGGGDGGGSAGAERVYDGGVDVDLLSAVHDEGVSAEGEGCADSDPGEGAEGGAHGDRAAGLLDGHGVEISEGEYVVQCADEWGGCGGAEGCAVADGMGADAGAAADGLGAGAGAGVPEQKR